MYYNKQDIMNRLQEHADAVTKKGLDYFFVAVQGSWNYGLGYEGSDVDTKALIIPTFKDIVLNKKPISTTHVMENEEHCDLKDARLMFQNFWKQNINFLEILFTPYVLVNPMYQGEYNALYRMREDIARYDIKKALNCMSGMAQEKLHALEHPYPTVADKIEKFGYDGKQLHHILRMEDFVNAYVGGDSFKDCLIDFTVYSKDILMKAKRNEFSLDEARALSAYSCKLIHNMKEDYLANHSTEVREDVREAAEEILYKVFEKKFRHELSN